MSIALTVSTIDKNKCKFLNLLLLQKTDYITEVNSITWISLTLFLIDMF